MIPWHWHQCQAMKPRLGSTVNRKYFYWPILRSWTRPSWWAKETQNPTVQTNSTAVAALRFEHSISKTAIFQSSRIRILSARLFWTCPRVYQIYPQIKKLIFLKIGSPRWGCAEGTVSLPGIEVWPRAATPVSDYIWGEVYRCLLSCEEPSVLRADVRLWGRGFASY